MKTDPISRKERERLVHKEEIVAGARKLFAEKGYHNVSMQEIAEATEFATGTLYNFFSSKEALYSELLQDCARKILSLLIPILESPDSEHLKIRQFIHAHQQIFTEHKDVVLLYLNEVNRLSMVLTPTEDETIERMRLEVLDRVRVVIQSGIERGHFRSCHAGMAAIALNGMLESLGFSAAAYPQTLSMEQGLPEIEALFFQGIQRGGNDYVG